MRATEIHLHGTNIWNCFFFFFFKGNPNNECLFLSSSLNFQSIKEILETPPRRQGSMESPGFGNLTSGIHNLLLPLTSRATMTV